MAELIPRKILFGNPDRGSPEVAPDGRRLAHLEPVDDVLNVWVGDIGGDAARPVTSDTDRGIRSYTWAADGRHLIYLQDSGGDENWHLHIVDPETGDDLISETACGKSIDRWQPYGVLSVAACPSDQVFNRVR